MSDFIAKKHVVGKEPLAHIVKRDACPWWRAILVRLLAFVLATLVISTLSILIIKENPLAVFNAMIDGTFGTERKIWVFIKDAAILLGIALAITPAFKMKFWNIGAEGQVLVAALAVYACDWYLRDTVSQNMMLVIMFVSALVAGMLWAIIPAFFKAMWNTNETLFTLMMNYIAIEFVTFFKRIWLKSSGNNYGSTTISFIKVGKLPEIYNMYLLCILIIAVITLFMFIYLKFSKHGYEVAVVGESRNTAKYIGINVKKVVIRTMALSGAICGIVGFLLCSGINHIVSETLVGGQGFTAIIVSWLAKFNPLIMVLTAALVIFLNTGTSQVVSKFKLGNKGFASVVVGLVFFFLIGCEFFLNYKIVFKSRKKKAKKEVIK